MRFLLPILLIAWPALAAERWSNATGPVGAASGVAIAAEGHALRKVRLYLEDGRVAGMRAVEAPIGGFGVRYAEGEVLAGRRWGDFRTLDAGEGRFVTGLQVCSGADGALRGLRLWGAPHRADGTLGPAAPAEIAGADCVRWHPPALCGRGGVAWSVKAWYETGRGITGLALRCRVP
jgi:hypothetical protein